MCLPATAAVPQLYGQTNLLQSNTTRICCRLRLASVPQLDGPIPATRQHLAGLQWVPLNANAGLLIVSLQDLDELAGLLPLPEETPPMAVARDDVAAIGGEVELRTLVVSET